MAGHAQLKFVMTECSKTQIRLTGLIYGVFTILMTGRLKKYFILVTMTVIHKIQVLPMFNYFLKLIDFSLANCVISSKSILRCITKLIFCETNTIWQTLSQNADLMEKNTLCWKNWFLNNVKLNINETFWSWLFLCFLTNWFILCCLKRLLWKRHRAAQKDAQSKSMSPFLINICTIIL